MGNWLKTLLHFKSGENLAPFGMATRVAKDLKFVVCVICTEFGFCKNQLMCWLISANWNLTLFFLLALLSFHHRVLYFNFYSVLIRIEGGRESRLFRDELSIRTVDAVSALILDISIMVARQRLKDATLYLVWEGQMRNVKDVNGGWLDDGLWGLPSVPSDRKAGF